MIARNLSPSRPHRFKSQFRDPYCGWSIKIIGKPIRFMLKHDSWRRSVIVTAATLHSRRRLETAIIENALVWPDQDHLDQLLGRDAQIGWVPGVIGKLIDEAREEFRMEVSE